jgi:hypothetical protein
VLVGPIAGAGIGVGCGASATATLGRTAWAAGALLRRVAG